MLIDVNAANTLSASYFRTKRPLCSEIGRIGAKYENTRINGPRPAIMGQTGGDVQEKKGR